MENGYRCHPLNILDDCNRFNLCIEALTSETFDAVKPIIDRLFREYGLPFSFLCDNGNPWGTAQNLGFVCHPFQSYIDHVSTLLQGQCQPCTKNLQTSLLQQLLRYHLF